MTKTYRQGAIGALLDEYERSITDLQNVIKDISDSELIQIVDSKTTDSSCKSIQTVLSHVVCSAYAYAIYILKFKKEEVLFRDEIFHFTISDYYNHLNDSFLFTVDTFQDIKDNQLEESDNDKKLSTSWGQIYDIEQIMEHAIVHVLRHRRQIERFKIILRNQE